MPFRNHSSLRSLAEKMKRLIPSRTSRRVASRRNARRHLLEQLENRNLMALNIISTLPLDNATNVPLNSDLVFTFNENVLKGQGNIHVVRSSTDTLGIAVDVQSPLVTVSGATVTVDLPEDLQLDNSYYVLMDPGTFIDTSSVVTPNATLQTQSFDLLPLGPFVFESGGDGTDFTLTPPLGYTVDNSQMPTGGVPEWSGWSFADNDAWAQVDDQSRSAFDLGNKTVAVADSDEWQDTTPRGPGNFKSFLQTKPVSLLGVAPNSVKLEFDSSFRPEDSQIGILEVRFDGSPTWTKLLQLDPTNTSNEAPNATNNIKNINERLVSGVNTGLSSDGFGNAPFLPVNNPSGASTVEFRFSLEGGNDWWWTIDDLLITGQIVGLPFDGVTDPTFWNFATPESPKLTLTIDKTFMSENGGTATGTISRNGLPTGDLVVTLVSSDTTEATVPATVTILDGQSSATFPITAVDDALADKTQTVLISATASAFAPSERSIDVTDDEGPKITSLTPADNSTNAPYNTDLSITFDVNVKKGNGFIYVVRTSDNVAKTTVDVRSSNVTIAGTTVAIDLPIALDGLTDYHVIIDDGAFIDTTTGANPGTVLLTQGFDFLELGPFTTEPGGDGTDFTKTPPLNFNVDNSQMPSGSTSDFNGWSFMDKNSWVQTAGNQRRGEFTRGTGVVAVADPDEWDDTPHNTGSFNSFLRTSPIDLTGVAAGSVVLEFDSSFRSEIPQIGVVQVSYDGGGSWTDILQFDLADGTNDHIRMDRNAPFDSQIGAGFVVGQLFNPSSGTMQFRFAMLNAGNNWWWAIDNIKVTGTGTGTPFQGIDNATTWNFRTGEPPTLSVTIAPSSISENGGTATGTVTRNLDTVGNLIVTLTSSDTTEATVPSTVTILDGQSSATFTITGIDDAIPDDGQVVFIAANAPTFFAGSASLTVTDDDFPKTNSLSPVDGSTAVPVESNFSVTFDQNVKKGNGFIHIVRASDDKSAVSVDVNSSAVTISGATVTIDPPMNLRGLTDYYVRIDRGAILGTDSFIRPGTTLLTQDFELMTLQPAVFETVGLTANGRDFTLTPPPGFEVDNTLMPPGGVPEWNGWSFAAKSFWQTQGGQGRASFTRGSGTIAVGETDEWDDTPTLNNSFNSKVLTNPIDLETVAAGSVVLEFDSSFRPENSQIGTLEVTFDGGTNWQTLLTLDPANTSNDLASANVNERRSIPVNNPDTGSMKFRWGVTGANDWWWAIDNIVVTGTVQGVSFPGIIDSTTWNFQTAEALTLTLTTDVTSLGENGGIATATVSRNLGTTGDLLVTLTSSDTSSATVPATVTIPNGQSSVTFPITAVDNALADASRNVTISATAANFVSGVSTVKVTDNEVVDVVISEIMYNPAGSEPRTEWIELYNRGSITADLSGWRFDDEDTTNWGAVPAGTLLQPGKTAVLFNGFFGATTEAQFRTDWAVPAEAVVVGVFWGNLDNSPNRLATPPNEAINLRDRAQTHWTW